ncbi:MAG: hypothetical protein V3S14_00960 [Anaerolineae bacterium]
MASTGLTMAEIITALEQMFREKGEGRVEMPPKPGIHTRADAFTPALESAGIKFLTRHLAAGIPG